MTDLRKTIVPKSDQLNADDFIGGQTLDIKVTAVTSKNEKEQPISIHFEGDNKKPYKPCLSMRRVLVQCWGPNGQDYVGRMMRLFRDNTVQWAGMEVGGIRISHLSHIPSSIHMALTASKTVKRMYEVRPLKADTQPQAAPVPIDPAVKAAGEEAAAKGVEDYTAWLAGLTPEVKATVKSMHSTWSTTAKAADAAKKPAASTDEPAAAAAPTTGAPGDADF